MDVRKKFIIQIIVLFIIVVALSIFVYISSTDDPFEQEQEDAPFGALPISESSRTSFNPFQTTPTGGADDNRVLLGTVTLRNPRIPRAVTDTDYDTPALEPGEALYTVMMTISWSDLLHPRWYPDGAHLSPAVAWSHRIENILFEEGETASDGIEQMAETGATTVLLDEIQEAGNNSFLLHYDTGALTPAPGEDTLKLIVSNEARYVSIVSMIAPSPDWFVAVRNVDLFRDGAWVERKTVPATLYDAGTDNGETFTAEDSDTQPREPITPHPEAPAVPMVTFEFIRS